VIRDGGIQFSDPAWLVLENIVINGAPANGINIDDGGSYDTPAHNVTIRKVIVRNVGPRGNRDGIKLSGVDDFVVRECTVERWGDGGSGIDMVGCHRGVIDQCRFEHGDRTGANAVQTKGGSSDILVRRCEFVHAGQRAVNIGGSTGLAYFRPKPQGYEAKDIVVEGCTFRGSMAPVAFVGVDGAIVRHNTIYRPRNWVVRILQETTGEDFVLSRNGRFENNIVVFRSDEISTFVNIGPNTAPDTFTFANNLWYCTNNPDRSKPNLPVEEKGGVYGVDPQLIDPEKGDLRVRADSPAVEKGIGALALPDSH
jgi:hypothetical protein